MSSDEARMRGMIWDNSTVIDGKPYCICNVTSDKKYCSLTITRFKSIVIAPDYSGALRINHHFRWGTDKSCLNCPD